MYFVSELELLNRLKVPLLLLENLLDDFEYVFPSVNSWSRVVLELVPFVVTELLLLVLPEPFRVTPFVDVSLLL